LAICQCEFGASFSGVGSFCSKFVLNITLLVALPTSAIGVQHLVYFIHCWLCKQQFFGHLGSLFI